MEKDLFIIQKFNIYRVLNIEMACLNYFQDWCNILKIYISFFICSTIVHFSSSGSDLINQLYDKFVPYNTAKYKHYAPNKSYITKINHCAVSPGLIKELAEAL